MRLLRQVNRTVNGVTYYKWRIGDLPAEMVESLGWEVGTELVADIRDGRLVIREKDGARSPKYAPTS